MVLLQRLDADDEHWARFLAGDEDREFAMDIEIAPRPDFEIRPLPADVTYQLACDWDRRFFPDLHFEP